MPPMVIYVGLLRMPNSTSSQRTKSGSGSPFSRTAVMGMQENHQAPYALSTSTFVRSFSTTSGSRST